MIVSSTSVSYTSSIFSYTQQSCVLVLHPIHLLHTINCHCLSDIDYNTCHSMRILHTTTTWISSHPLQLDYFQQWRVAGRMQFRPIHHSVHPGHYHSPLFFLHILHAHRTIGGYQYQYIENCTVKNEVGDGVQPRRVCTSLDGIQ